MALSGDLVLSIADIDSIARTTSIS
ncbi:hypothetical protein ACWC2T_06735 [Streptomyces sp. NPDC001393]